MGAIKYCFPLVRCFECRYQLLMPHLESNTANFLWKTTYESVIFQDIKVHLSYSCLFHLYILQYFRFFKFSNNKLFSHWPMGCLHPHEEYLCRLNIRNFCKNIQDASEVQSITKWTCKLYKGWVNENVSTYLLNLHFIIILSFKAKLIWIFQQYIP